MRLNINTTNFHIRLADEVGYLKVIGYQDKQSSLFFSQTIDQMLNEYPHQNFASLCDLQDLVLDDPKNAIIINNAINKIANHVNFEYNAIVIRPKFFDIVKAYIFSYYLKNIKVKSKIFFNLEKAVEWLEKNNIKFDEIKSEIIQNN